MMASFNIFNWVFGSPVDRKALASFDAAASDLRAARLAGDKVAEANALARMQAGAKTMTQQSNLAVAVATAPADVLDAIKNAASGTASSLFGFSGRALASFALFAITLAWVYGRAGRA